MFNVTNPYFDVVLSSIWYDDWKTDLEYNNQLLMFRGRNGVDYVVLADDLSKPYYKKSELSKMKKSELIDLICDLGFYINGSCTKSDLITEIIGLADIEYYYTKHHENRRWHDLECDFTVYGHCQGDAIKVIILSGDLKRNTKETLTNLFYDTPINHGKIEFLDQEIYLDGYAENFYEWDKEALISNFEKNYKGWYKNRIIELIKDLPDPEY